jgi:hypothetical protein
LTALTGALAAGLTGLAFAARGAALLLSDGFAVGFASLVPAALEGFDVFLDDARFAAAMVKIPFTLWITRYSI